MWGDYHGRSGVGVWFSWGIDLFFIGVGLESRGRSMADGYGHYLIRALWYGHRLCEV